MATISESYVSRPFTIGQSAGRELIYDVVGTDDESAVEALLLATAPGTYSGLAVESVSAEPAGNGVWKGYVRYARREDDDEYTFDIGGGTQRMLQSLATVARYAAPYTVAPDFQGAINVSEDRVEGVDVPVSSYDFMETHRFTFPNLAAERAYQFLLSRMCPAVNNATFRGFAAGECLFRGVSGSKRGDDAWSLTFRFSCSPNVFNATIGADTVGYGGYGEGVISGIDKLGWDYLWVRYADFEDDDATALVKRPVAAYVERLFQFADFSLLDIGTL